MVASVLLLLILRVGISSETSLETFCAPDGGIPDDLIRCGSCMNSCGEVGSGGNCFCDNQCLFYSDCCADFQTQCFQDYFEARVVSTQFPRQFHHEDFKCVSNVLAIAVCPDKTPCTYNSTDYDDVNTFVPMYDVTKKVHYVSGYCALCNGADDVIPWEVSLKCNKIVQSWLCPWCSSGIPGISVSGPARSRPTRIDSPELFNQERRSEYCILDLAKPIRAEHRCQQFVKSSCRDDCLNEELETKCVTSPSEYIYLGSGFGDVFRNPYCALCGGDPRYSMDDLTCMPSGTPPPSPPPPTPARPPLPPTPSPPPPIQGWLTWEPPDSGRFLSPDSGLFPSPRLPINPSPRLPINPNIQQPLPPTHSTIASYSTTVVFDFDPRNGLAIGEHLSDKCEPGKAYHLVEDTCREVTCPSGLTLEGPRCVPEISAIVFVFEGNLQDRSAIQTQHYRT